jgi:hypothetical protein
MNGDAPLAPDELQILDRGLAGAAEALDREIAASGALDRVTGRVMARVARRPARRAIWFAIAAALVVAAGLGSLADLVFVDARISAGQEVVVMDPLVFEPAVTGQR